MRATFVLALIITVSYSVTRRNIPVHSTDIVEPNKKLEATAVKLSNGVFDQMTLLKMPKLSRPPTAHGLSADEVKLAVVAGQAALDARQAADLITRPFPSPSPNSRHQYSLSTNLRADRLALTGVAEIAATRNLEAARSFMGRSSSFGSYLDGGWLSDSVCIDSWNVYCPVYAARYRKFDGSCNHPDQLGMALTPFQRTLPPDYADGIDAPRIGVFGNSLPSARKVSLKVHTPLPSSNPSFTVMLAVFGQFLDHDLTATAISQGKNGSSLTCCPPNGGSHPECFSVEVGPGDPVFDLTNTTCLEFIRSAPAPQCKVGSRQQLNQVTSFIDGSMVYGSDENTAKDLRYFLGGQLRMQVTQDDRLLLPASTNPFDGCNRQLELARGRYCFASGDVRANENLHLTTMHLLWARQHNRLANQFSQINPNWDDEIIYQEVRRIVGAQIQHIAYTEFLPIVIGKTEMSAHDLKPLAEGFRPKNDSDNINPAIANNFAAAAFRFAHTLLPGLMRVTDKLKGTTSYVQLHKMLFNPYSLYSKGGVESSITTATSNTIQDTSTHVTSQLTAHLFEDPLGNKTIPCGLDLVSLNIQRGRDHGLPGYTKWRKYCGLKIPHNFGDLKDDMDPAALDSISELYENVDDLDLYTGALAEIHDGDKLLGPTFTCLIADQFKRLQKGDKFWYEFGDHPGSFTEDQLKELRKSSLARIICDTSDEIEEIQASVMRSIGPDNPVVACKDIPQLSLNPWKTPTPLITVFETDIPMMDWLRFQSEVNKTINSIISNILNKKSPSKSLTSHWFFFQHNLRTLFEDLKIKFAALNPKMITDTNFKKNTSDFNLFLIEDMIDSGISNIENFLSMDVPFSKSSLEDWINFKRNSINTLLIIENEFNDINVNLNKLQSYWREIFTLKIIPINWDSIKYDMNATISNVILTINAHNILFNGTFPFWSKLSKKNNTFLWSIRHQPNIRQFKHINLLNQTISFDNKTNFNVHEGNHNFLRTLEYQFTIKNNTNSLWSQIRNQSMVDFEFGSDRIFLTKKALSETKKKKNLDRVIKVIRDTFYETQKKKPDLEGAKKSLLYFKQIIDHTLTKLKQKYTFFYAKIQGKKKELLKNFAEDVKIYNSSSEDFLQNVIAKLLRFVKTKKPIPDHPKHVWFTYKTVVKGLFMQAYDQTKNFKIHQILQCKSSSFGTEECCLSDKLKWRNTINNFTKNIEILLSQNNFTLKNLQGYVNKSVRNLKKSISNKLYQQSHSKIMAIIHVEWQTFVNHVNIIMDDIINNVITNDLSELQYPEANFNLYIRNQFFVIQEDIKSIQMNFLEKVETATRIIKVSSALPTENRSLSFKQQTAEVYYYLTIFYLTTILFYE